MLNKLLKTSYMLVLAIVLSACGDAGTPSGGGNDIEIQVPKDSDLGKEIDSSEPGAFMPNTRISVHFSDGTESPTIDYANQAAWKAGFNIDFTNTPLDKITMSNHIINPDFEIETKFYTKKGVLFVTEVRRVNAKLENGLHFTLNNVRVNLTGNTSWASTTPSGEEKYPAGTTLDDLTTIYTLATYKAGGKTYHVVSPTMHIKFPANAPQPTTV